MAFKHEYTTTLTLGSHERDVVITYTVTPGWEGDRTDPGYPAEVSIERVEIEVQSVERFGKPTVKTFEPAPQWLIDIISNCPDLYSEMLYEAGEEDSDRAADAALMRREDARMGL